MSEKMDGKIEWREPSYLGPTIELSRALRYCRVLIGIVDIIGEHLPLPDDYDETEWIQNPDEQQRKARERAASWAIDNVDAIERAIYEKAEGWEKDVGLEPADESTTGDDDNEG